MACLIRNRFGYVLGYIASVEDRFRSRTGASMHVREGGDDGTRTRNPCLAKAVLCQLSYAPQAPDQGTPSTYMIIFSAWFASGQVACGIVSETIEILEIGPHEYAVTVNEGHRQTRHRVTVPQELIDEVGLALALADADGEKGLRDTEERLIRESFAFLLEREPATSIMREFGLDVIGRFFPDYVSAMRTRLGTAP